jgi:hypothetical protein
MAESSVRIYCIVICKLGRPLKFERLSVLLDAERLLCPRDILYILGVFAPCVNEWACLFG